MSDYSNLKFRKVADIPKNAHVRAAKPLSYSRIRETLPFLDTMEIGDVIEFEVPEDYFGYKPNKDKILGSVYTAISRAFAIIAEKEKKFFIVRVREDKCYIKRVDS